MNSILRTSLGQWTLSRAGSSEEYLNASSRQPSRTSAVKDPRSILAQKTGRPPHGACVVSTLTHFNCSMASSGCAPSESAQSMKLRQNFALNCLGCRIMYVHQSTLQKRHQSALCASAHIRRHQCDLFALFFLVARTWTCLLDGAAGYETACFNLSDQTFFL